MTVTHGAPWRALARTLLDFVFPDHCLSCGRPLDDGARHVCAHCRAAISPCLRVIRLPALSGDGRHVRREAICLFEFSGPTRDLVHALKYGGRPSVADFLIREAAQELAACRPLLNTAVVPIPLHPVRERERGYNQAELLARGIASCVGGSVASGALLRCRHTRAQARLSRPERAENVRGAFRARASRLAGRPVLLVDDVVTTGATMAAAAAALLDAGAGPAVCLTVTSAPAPM